MKRYTVAQARERLSDVLNEAERSGGVIVQRRDVQYVIRLHTRTRSRSKRQPLIDTLDAAVAAGDWEWTPARGGLRFAPRRASKP